MVFAYSMVVDHQASCCHGGFFCLRRSVLGDFCSNGCLPQSRLRLRLFWIFCKEFACVWTATLGPRSSPFIITVGRIHYLNCKGSQIVQSYPSLPPGERVPFITRPDRTRRDQTLQILPTKDHRDEDVPSGGSTKWPGRW